MLWFSWHFHILVVGVGGGVSHGSLRCWFCCGEVGVLMAVTDAGCGGRGSVLMAVPDRGCEGVRLGFSWQSQTLVVGWRGGVLLAVPEVF